jgi:hypothetical protein
MIFLRYTTGMYFARQRFYAFADWRHEYAVEGVAGK